MDKSKGVIYLTGFYGQLIAIQIKDIIQMFPHRAWTEIYIAGGQSVKVMEIGEKIQAMIDEVEKGESENVSVTGESGNN